MLRLVSQSKVSNSSLKADQTCQKLVTSNKNFHHDNGITILLYDYSMIWNSKCRQGNGHNPWLVETICQYNMYYRNKIFANLTSHLNRHLVKVFELSPLKLSLILTASYKNYFFPFEKMKVQDYALKGDSYQHISNFVLYHIYHATKMKVVKRILSV